jgi:pimeloyl-ACP methyl ester carboxylesterase
MPRFNSPFDGAQLFYRDYVPATYPPAFSPVAGYENKTLPTLVFIHGWPMSSSMFEHLMVQLCESYRFRCIASDRRGFGNSDWNGSEPVSSPIDYSVFAADTVHLLEKVKPGPFIFVAASMGPGETIEAYFQSQFVRDNCKVNRDFFWFSLLVLFGC